jgi:hypothetical protein
MRTGWSKPAECVGNFVCEPYNHALSRAGGRVWRQARKAESGTR